MKKLLIIILCIVMLLPIVSCGSVIDGKTASINGSSTVDTATPPVLTPKVREVPDGIPKTAKNLIHDDMFQCGIRCCGSKVSSADCGHMDYGGIANYANQSWYAGQWATRQTLGTKGNNGEAYKMIYTDKGNGVYNYSNDAKHIEVDTKNGAITLGVNTKYEYEHKERPTAESWVHLLLCDTKCVTDMPYIKDLSGVWAYADFSINQADFENVDTSKYGKAAQTTQLVWYLQIHSGSYYINKEGVKTERTIWFGIPLYDSYGDSAKPFIQGEAMTMDPGTDMGLYCVPMDEYMTSYAKPDKTRHRIVVKLDDFAIYCFNEAVKNGLFPKECKFEDARYHFSNIGWEVPGTCECEATIYGVGVYYDEKK